MGPGTETSTGPVLAPFPPMAMSATKIFPKLFAVSRLASVVLVTVKVISWKVGVDPPLQLARMAHVIPKVNIPVPSPLKPPGVTAWSPTRPPGTAFAGMPVSGLMMFVAVAPDAVLLNLKSWSSADPVVTNLFESDKTISTLTDVPTCVSVTVPNVAPGVHPLEAWHDVKVNESAWLILENAVLPASNAAPAKAARHDTLYMMISPILRVCKRAAKTHCHSQQKALPKL